MGSIKSANVGSIRQDLENIQEATLVNLSTGVEMKEVIDTTSQLFAQVISSSTEVEQSVGDMETIVHRIGDAIELVRDNIDNISATTDQNLSVVQESTEVVSAFNEDISILKTSIGELSHISNDFYEFISTETIDKILTNRMDHLVTKVDQCTSVEACIKIAKEVNVAQFQVLNNKGEIIAATQAESMSLNLFELYPPYKEFFENSNRGKYLFTPVVPKLDGYYGKFCASKVGNNLVTAEYSFNIKVKSSN